MRGDRLEGGDMGWTITGQGIPPGARITSLTSTSATFSATPARVWRSAGPGSVSLVDYAFGAGAAAVAATFHTTWWLAGLFVGVMFAAFTVGGRLGILLYRWERAHPQKGVGLHRESGLPSDQEVPDGR